MSAAIVSAAIASSAVAAPSWRPTVDVEPSPPVGSLVFPKIVARADGCSSVVFPRGGVLATTRPAGGSFASPPQNLGTLLGGEYPEVAFGGGTAAAVWLDGSSKLRISTATGCGPFATAAEVPSSPASPNHARVAVDSNGTTIAVVGGGLSGSRRAYVSERPAGGSPATAAPLPISSGEGFRPWVATSSEGGAAIVFDVVDGGNQVYGSLRSGSGWSTPVRLNEEGKTVVAESARVAIGPDGVLHATWIDATNGKLIFASLPPGGPPTRLTLQEVSGGGITAEPPAAPKIAEDAEGRIAVIWVQEAAGVRTVKAKVREPGSSTFSGPLDVSPLTNQPRGYPWIAIDEDGRLVAAYSNSPSIGHVDAWGATLEPGATAFSEPVLLGEAAHVTQPSGISTDADGNTLVAVYKSDGTTEARVAPFDAAGPLLNGLSIPSAGTVGSPLAFSVASVDAWSALGATTWSFGDGGTATGNSVSHTFGSPGARSVAVAATDALGNSSEANGPVAVGASAGEGAPVLTDLKLSNRRFQVAGATKPKKKNAARGSRKAPVGTKISFRLSEAARVRLAIRPRRMKRRGAIPRGFTDRGILQRSAKAGANEFRFNGKLGGRRLIAEQFRLEVTATDPDGNDSKPQSVTFTIVGR
jgi:hypothetical protein